MEIKSNFYINPHLINGLGMELTLAKASGWQIERWHHLLYVTHITTLPVGHCYLRHKVSYAQNI